MKRKEKIKWFDRESRGLLRLIINHDKSDHINHGLSKDDIYSLYSKNGREQRVHKIDTCLKYLVEIGLLDFENGVYELTQPGKRYFEDEIHEFIKNDILKVIAGIMISVISTVISTNLKPNQDNSNLNVQEDTGFQQEKPHISADSIEILIKINPEKFLSKDFTSITTDTIIKSDNQQKDYKYSIYDGTEGRYVQITEYLGDREHVIIPESLEELPVRVIAENVFKIMNG